MNKLRRAELSHLPNARSTGLPSVEFLATVRDALGRWGEVVGVGSWGGLGDYVSQHAALGHGGGVAVSTRLSFLGTERERERESKP